MPDKGPAPIFASSRATCRGDPQRCPQRHPGPPPRPRRRQPLSRPELTARRRRRNLGCTASPRSCQAAASAAGAWAAVKPSEATGRSSRSSLRRRLDVTVASAGATPQASRGFVVSTRSPSDVAVMSRQCHSYVTPAGPRATSRQCRGDVAAMSQLCHTPQRRRSVSGVSAADTSACNTDNTIGQLLCSGPQSDGLALTVSLH